MTITNFYYLDTCTLVGWCCADTSSANSLDYACSAALDRLLVSSTSRVAISELTLIELHNTLAKLWRTSNASHFDELWVASSMKKVMAKIASDALEVVAAPPKATEHAMLLVTLATKDHGLGFKAWDARHLITAAGWARGVGEQVRIVTSDKDFKRFFDAFDYFRQLVDLVLITT